MEWEQNWKRNKTGTEMEREWSGNGTEMEQRSNGRTMNAQFKVPGLLYDCI